MVNNYAECVFFSIGNRTLEQVEGYNYLGQVVSADPNHEKKSAPNTNGLGCIRQALANNKQ